MRDHVTPQMSVVLITRDTLAPLCRTLAHLQSQSVRDRLEIVVVAASARDLALDEAQLGGFHSVRVVEVGDIQSIPEAKAAGAWAASAPIVVFCEDHSYPQPGWAQALIAAHEDSWAAVGPIILNANPNSALSWTELLTSYGQWVGDRASGVIKEVPPNSSAYKREILLSYKDALPEMLQAEMTLSEALRSRGYQLYLERDAKSAHLNYSLLGPWLKCQVIGARMFAGGRAQNWSLLRRILYIGGGFLIPPVRLWRILRDSRVLSKQPFMLVRVFPSMALTLVVAAAGEVLGYALGSGTTVRDFVEYEVDRERYIRDADRRSLPEGIPPAEQVSRIPPFQD